LHCTRSVNYRTKCRPPGVRASWHSYLKTQKTHRLNLRGTTRPGNKPLASTLTPPILAPSAQQEQVGSDLAFAAIFVTVLTALALGVHGYHPYAEDGGLYMAGVKRLLNPALYPHWSEFVTEHLRFSLFAPLIAALVRALRLPLMTVWLGLYLATFWLTLFAAWLLATRCYVCRTARCGAVALLTVWLTIPIAGTSLMLMDPYFSARSISTPCSLFALLAVLDLFLPRTSAGLRPKRSQTIALLGSSLVIAALIHPLMAAYAFGCTLILACMLTPNRRIRIAGVATLCAVALGIATALYYRAPPESQAYLHVALTRTYWFVARWQWYEQFGLAAPLAILAAISLQRPSPSHRPARALARTALVAGSVAFAVAMLFARTSAPTYIVARLQPLRIFQIVYILMILAVGATLGERVLQRKKAYWAITFTLLAAIMVLADRQTFPRSAHLELPGRQTTNGWQRAFEWISQSTPVDALFALDAHYVTQPGEDAQTFRAIAERSALADYSKDGGEASISPDLTSAWSIGQTAQTGLNTAPDNSRIAKLRPLGVTWVVLPSAAITSFQCDYADEAVKVCRLPKP
jgi:hypothetical protein